MGEKDNEKSEKVDGAVGELAVERQLVTRAQLDNAASAHKTILSLGMKKTLAEVLVEKGLVTKVQAQALVKEAESGGEAKFINGYELVHKLGEGAMGVVYKAREISLDRLVALKVLPPNLASNEEFLARFKREARIAAQLDHVNVVRALAVGEADGYHFFAMEFVAGESLGDVLEREGVLDERRAIRFMIQMARALNHAAEHSLIHRDIKPDNILIAPGDVAKLADLGLARSTAESTRMTQTGTAMGTPHYISPEQARGEREIDIRTDIYSLGVTFFHLVTGGVPFEGSTAAVVITRRLSEPPPMASELNPNVSEDIVRIIRMMMEPERDRRYRSPADLERDLELVADGKPVQYAAPLDAYAAAAAAPGQQLDATLLGSPEQIADDLRRWKGGEKAQSAFATAAPTTTKGAMVLGLVAGGLVLVGVVIAVVVVMFVMKPGVPEPVAVPVVPAVAAADTQAAKLEKEALSAYEELLQLKGDEHFDVVLEKTEEIGDTYLSTPYGPRIAKLAAEARDKVDKAESEYKNAQGLADRTQYEAALAVARPAIRKYGGMSHGKKFEQLATSLEATIAEQRAAAEATALAAAAAKEKAYQDNLREGDTARDAKRYRDALTAYSEAAKIKDTVEVKGRITNCLFETLVAAGAEAEQKKQYDDAVAKYEKALERKHSAQLRERVHSLKALISLERKIAVADAARDAGRLPEALGTYKSCLPAAAGEHRKHVESNIADIESTLAYDKAMAAAGTAYANYDWKRLLTHSRKALSHRPDDKKAQQMLHVAQKRLELPLSVVSKVTGISFVLVRAGSFHMGAPEGEGDEDERPLHSVLLDDFYVSVHETTNAQYEKFEPEHEKRRGKARVFGTGDDYPAVFVSYDQAVEFCDWLSKREGFKYRLPTEAEWEYAARGNDNRKYPWGNQDAIEGSVHRCNLGEGKDQKIWEADGYRYLAPVGRFERGKSPWGVMDMAGNVWEWCLDWYSPDYYAGCDNRVKNPAGPGTGEKRVRRGGAYSNSRLAARSANRSKIDPSRQSNATGFRVVRVAE